VAVYLNILFLEFLNEYLFEVTTNFSGKFNFDSYVAQDTDQWRNYLETNVPRCLHMVNIFLMSKKFCHFCKDQFLMSLEKTTLPQMSEYLLTYTMVQNIISKDDCHSAYQKTSRFIYGTRRFITVFTKARHRILSGAS
jgi:hypothetical protein